QAEQCPGRLLEVAYLLLVCHGQLVIADHLQEGLWDIDGAGYETAAEHRPVVQLVARSPPLVFDYPLDDRAGAELAPSSDKRLHETPRQGDTAALGDLVVRNQVETPHERPHRASRRNLVVQDRAEQRHLE